MKNHTPTPQQNLPPRNCHPNKQTNKFPNPQIQKTIPHVTKQQFRPTGTQKTPPFPSKSRENSYVDDLNYESPKLLPAPIDQVLNQSSNLNEGVLLENGKRENNNDVGGNLNVQQKNRNSSNGFGNRGHASYANSNSTDSKAKSNLPMQSHQKILIETV